MEASHGFSSSVAADQAVLLHTRIAMASEDLAKKMALAPHFVMLAH